MKQEASLTSTESFKVYEALTETLTHLTLPIILMRILCVEMATWIAEGAQGPGGAGRGRAPNLRTHVLYCLAGEGYPGEGKCMVINLLMSTSLAVSFNPHSPERKAL